VCEYEQLKAGKRTVMKD